jgi:hypothetical protein
MADQFDSMRMQVEMYERDVVKGLTADERKLLFDDAVRQLPYAVRNIRFTLDEERNAGLLTAAGVRARGGQLAKEVVKSVEKMEAQRRQVEEQIAQMRKDALAVDFVKDGSGWVRKAKASPTAEQLVEEREVRDLIRQQLDAGKMQPFELSQRYLDAVRDGSDPAFVGALERAPRAFPLLDARTRAQADEIRIAQSPLAETINRLAFTLPFHERITLVAREELQALGYEEQDDMAARLQADAVARGRA